MERANHTQPIQISTTKDAALSAGVGNSLRGTPHNRPLVPTIAPGLIRYRRTSLQHGLGATLSHVLSPQKSKVDATLAVGRP